jgi:DNA-binding response OmpR family regulator
MANTYTIVLVEDDSFLQHLYETKFVNEGFTVRCASDGLKGLALIKEVKPNLALLDVDLPKLDGLGILQALRAEEYFKQLPVIMLTNSSNQQRIDLARSLGVSEYLIKAHFLPSEVVTKVRTLLNIH